MKSLELRPLFTVFAALGLLTGAVYPLAMTGIGQVLFSHQVNGSLVHDAQGAVTGSEHLAQKFTSSAFFQARPSAADFATVSSGASNLSPVGKAQQEARREREAAWVSRGGGTPVPETLLTASGSGLDPHLPPEAVLYQAPLVAEARSMNLDVLNRLIAQSTEKPVMGFIGQERVNVLELNRRLEASEPSRTGQ